MESVPEMAMSSVLAGSLRWMAPELLIAAVEDNIPHLTVHSDVYAFGAVCLEVRPLISIDQRQFLRAEPNLNS